MRLELSCLPRIDARHPLRVCNLLLVVSGALLATERFPCSALAQGPDAAPRRSEESRSRITRITVKSREGFIQWSDVLAGLARAGGLDEQVVRQLLPSGSIDLRRTSSRLTVMALDLALSPGVRLQTTLLDSNEPALVIIIDHEALEDRPRDLPAGVRDQREAGRPASRPVKHGLVLPPDWGESPADVPSVVVIHGFGSSTRQVGALAAAIGEAGFPTALFSYPNDQPIDNSALLLSIDLQQLRRDDPQRELALVTHSMGGLVARAMIENPELDPGNVTHLIMLAPPNHGSQLADLGDFSSFWESLLIPADQRRVSRFYEGFEDGLGEAAAELQPGSPFLQRLNSRPRNPKVRYTVVLGTRGLLMDRELQAAQSALVQAGNGSQLMGVLRPKLDEFLKDLDEVVIGKGDGVVAVKRGRLQGVEDTVLMDFSHLGVLPARAALIEPELREVITTRLAQ